ncbi:MAG: hypothetical protein ABSG37_06010 [Candidatus Limnocylindrales bacterium]|jgi:hypothetical protein
MAEVIDDLPATVSDPAFTLSSQPALKASAGQPKQVSAGPQDSFGFWPGSTVA